MPTVKHFYYVAYFGATNDWLVGYATCHDEFNVAGVMAMLVEKYKSVGVITFYSEISEAQMHRLRAGILEPNLPPPAAVLAFPRARAPAPPVDSPPAS